MNILILKPGAIGDLLLLTPVIRQLKKNYKEAKISILVSSEATKLLFVNNPFVDKIFVYEKKGKHKGFISFLKLCKEIKKEHYDLVLNFQRSNLRLWFLVLFIKPVRVLAYHKDETKHAVINHLETILPLKIDVNLQEVDLDLFIDEDSEKFANNLLVDRGLTNKEFIVLNPGASHSVNRWPVDKFAELAMLIREKLHKKIVLIAGKEEVGLNETIKKMLDFEVVDLSGRLNLLQLAAVLKRSKMFVTGDTGPMHIATAMGTKVIALFGAADPNRTGPVGNGHIVIQAKDVKCVPCRKRSCCNKNYLECMKKIEPEDVLKFIV